MNVPIVKRNNIRLFLERVLQFIDDVEEHVYEDQDGAPDAGSHGQTAAALYGDARKMRANVKAFVAFADHASDLLNEVRRFIPEAVDGDTGIRGRRGEELTEKLERFCKGWFRTAEERAIAQKLHEVVVRGGLTMGGLAGILDAVGDMSCEGFKPQTIAAAVRAVDRREST